MPKRADIELVLVAVPGAEPATPSRAFPAPSVVAIKETDD